MPQLLTQSPTEICCLSSYNLQNFKVAEDKLQNAMAESKPELLANVLLMLPEH